MPLSELDFMMLQKRSKINLKTWAYDRVNSLNLYCIAVVFYPLNEKKEEKWDILRIAI